MKKITTYLENSTKKEYVIIGNDYPLKTGSYLSTLEKSAKWNLIFDTICIRHSTLPLGYIDVKHHVYVISEKTGGEIIPELINLHDLVKF